MEGDGKDIMSYTGSVLTTEWQKWMFCIDRTTFVASLYEYLRDMYLSPPTDTTSSAQAEGQLEEELNIEETQDLQNSGIQAGALHKDFWTLDYFNIAAYSQRIQLAFDDDNSGFVRISEVNAFARSIPPGFNLAQWCAYHAVGASIKIAANLFLISSFRLSLRDAYLPTSYSQVIHPHGGDAEEWYASYLHS